MSVQSILAPDFADHVIGCVHDIDTKWFSDVEPERQAAAAAAYDNAMRNYNAPRAGIEPISVMHEEYLGLAILAFYAGVRMGAAAEQFRQALSTINQG